jgi:hypothetical protein
MDTHKAFIIGLVILVLFVTGTAIWTILTPPVGDEMQAYALVAIGIFMGIIGYEIARRKPN